jgi:hypothetical protein
MSRTTTRRPGRLRAIAVAGALAVSMLAGVASPAAATMPPEHSSGTPSDAPGLAHEVKPRDAAAEMLRERHGDKLDDTGDDAVFTPLGWSWF